MDNLRKENQTNVRATGSFNSDNSTSSCTNGKCKSSSSSANGDCKGMECLEILSNSWWDL